MWQRQDSGIWGGGDYLDKQDYFSNKVDEFMDRKFQNKINKEIQLDLNSSNQESK